jgi:RND family efflux transporter MFP subunit
MIVVGLSAAALVGCGRSQEGDPGADSGSPAPVAVETARAIVRPVETIVTAQGTLAPGQGASARISSVTSGRLSAILVREGDHVSAGQAVATLDARAASAQASSAAAALNAASAQAVEAQYGAKAAVADQANGLNQARLALSAARIDRDNAIQNARTTLQSAETDLAKMRAGARPQEIAQAEQSVKQAQATRDRDATELERVRFLFEKGVAAKRQLDDAETALSVAESSLESAKAQASLVRAGSRSEDVRAAELRVRSAREAQSQAHRSGDAHVLQAQAGLRQAQQGVLQVAAKRQESVSMAEAAAQKQADLAAAQVAAGTTILRSPIAGIVTRRTANPGDMTDPAATVLEIADTRSLDLIADLPAEQGASVRAGQTVRVDAGGQAAGGRVLNVGAVDPQTNLLSVRIAVSNLDGKLKAGAFAMARIVVHTDPRGLVAPKEAVLTREGKSVVFTVSPDGTAHERAVSLGPEQDGAVEVRGGLKPGETVIRLGQYELTDGMKVKAAGFNKGKSGRD